jgi:hypothetical protein
MSEWEINKPLGLCSGSGRKIRYGEEYFGALVETAEGLQRRDFCAEYWNSEKPDVFCFWKSRLASPDQKKARFIDDEMLMAFFQRLENETESRKVDFRFVLALVMMRKKILKYDQTKNNRDNEIWRLRVVGENRTVDVLNPHLSEDQIEQLSSQMGQILQTDL